MNVCILIWEFPKKGDHNINSRIHKNDPKIRHKTPMCLPASAFLFGCIEATTLQLSAHSSCCGRLSSVRLSVEPPVFRCSAVGKFGRHYLESVLDLAIFISQSLINGAGRTDWPVLEGSGRWAVLRALRI